MEPMLGLVPVQQPLTLEQTTALAQIQERWLDYNTDMTQAVADSIAQEKFNTGEWQWGQTTWYANGQHFCPGYSSCFNCYGD